MYLTWKQVFTCAKLRGKPIIEPKFDVTRIPIEELPEDSPELDYTDFEPQGESTKVQAFFVNRFSGWIFSFKGVIILIGMILYAFNCWSLSLLTTSNRPESMLKKTNVLEKALIWAKYELWQDDKIIIEFNWGIQ
jgi:hypothetical protein